MIAIADVRQHPDFAHLMPVADGSAKAVAANIRADLKKHFKAVWPDVKFRVRTQYSDAVSVTWEDGPTQEKVEKILHKYCDGSFDPMQDIYFYHASAFNKVFGGIKYPSAKREYSDDMVGRAIELFHKKYPQYRSLDCVTVENYRRGKLMSEARDFFTSGIQSEIRLILRESE